MKNRVLFYNILLGIFIFLSLSVTSIKGATRTASISGNWSNTATWGGSPVPIATDDVIINSGITVTVDVTAACASVVINTSSPNNGITINLSNSLSVSGAITMNNPASNNVTSLLSVGTGTLNAGSILMASNGNVSRVTQITVSTGIINCSGSITFSGGAAENQIIFSGAGTLNIGGSLETGCALTAGTGTINLTGASPVIAGYTYYNLTFSGTGTTSASGALTIQGNLLNTGSGVLNFSSFGVTLSGAVTANDIHGFTTTGTVSMTKTAGIATLTDNVSGRGLTINGSGGTLNLGAGLTHTFTGVVTLTAGSLNGGSSTLNENFTGTAWTGTGSIFNAGTGLVNFGGGNQTIAAASIFNNLTVSNSGLKTLTGVPTVNGILSMEGTATVSVAPVYGSSATLRYNTATSRNTGPEWITPFIATGGIIIDNTGTISPLAVKTLNSGIDMTINPGASFSTGGNAFSMGGDLINNGSFSATGTTVTFSGNVPQSILGSSPTTFVNLSVNNSLGLTLGGSANTTVTGNLNFLSGKLTTGTDTLIMGNAGTIFISAGGYVNGFLEKGVATGITSMTFETGDASVYTPVALTFTATTNSTGSITAYSTPGDHPGIATSDINPSHSVNRFWTILNNGVTGIASYTAIFTFVAGDIDGGSDTSNFTVQNYLPSTWTSQTTGTKTGTTTQATGITLFGDFQVGEAAAAPTACLYADNGTIPTIADVIPCINFPSNPQTISSAFSAHQYFTMNVIKGIIYEVYSCNTTSPASPLMLEVYREGAPANPIIAFSYGNAGSPCTAIANNAYVSFTASFSGKVRVLVNKRRDCSSSTPAGLTIMVNASGGSNSLDNQTAAGSNTWIGHIYDAKNNAILFNGTFSNYIGYYSEPELFDESFGGNTNCFNPVKSNDTARANVYTESYSVRYRMVSSRDGLYVVDLGNDDGGRLAIDGTLVYNNWSDQVYTLKPRVLISLNGNSSLVYDFYENGGANQVTFNNLILVLANNLTTNINQNLCLGTAGLPISGDSYGTLPTGITLSGTGYQWTYSTTPAGTRITLAGATAATYTPTSATAPFNVAGTYYLYRNAILSSANNVAPNPYVATNESNAAILTVNPIPLAPVSASANPATIYPTYSGTIILTAIGGGTGSGDVLKWYKGGCGSGTPVGSGNPITIPAPSATTVYYARWENGSCYSGCITTQVSVMDVYRSKTSGNWNDISTWQVFTNDASVWIDATCMPTSSNGTITIQSPHVVTIIPATGSINVDELTIDPGAKLVVNLNPSGYWLNIVNGPGVDLTVNGTLEYQDDIVQLVNGAQMTVGSGGKYQHNINYAGNYPITIPTATWDPNSTCEILSSNQLAPAAGLNQTFGNFTWNYTGQTTTLNFAGALQNILGNFTIVSTGTTGKVQLTNTTGLTLNVGRDFILQDGYLDFGSGAAATKIYNLSGNYNQTGGTFINTNSNPLTFNFKGAGKTFVQSGGTLTPSNINWNINSGASLTLLNILPVSGSRSCQVNGTLDCGISTNVSGAGTFTLSPAATLIMGSPDGITLSGGTGNISTSVRNFSNAANYIYDGITAQNAGNGLPPIVNNLTINNVVGVSLSGASGVNGILALSNGAFSLGPNSFIFQNSDTPVLKTLGTMTTNPGTNLTFGTNGNTGGLAFTIPVGTFTTSPTINNLTINRINGLTWNDQPLSIKGILLANGPLNTNNQLTLLSTVDQAALIDGSGTGQVTGNVTLQRYIPSAFGYKYFSSPFVSAQVSQFSSYVDLNATFPNFYRYDETQSDKWWITYTNPSGLLVPAQGYAANFGTTNLPVTVSLSGVVNNGSIPTATLYNHNYPFTTGFNLVGNPYPSPIDWDASSGWIRMNADNAVYYFNASDSNEYTGKYSSYINGVSSDGIANNIIPSLQGFFVHVSNGSYPVSGSLTFTNQARINNLNPLFHKPEGGRSIPFLRFSAGFENSPGNEDPMVVYFNDAASWKFDNDFDALKMMNTDTQVPNLYSFSSDAFKLSINALPAPVDSVSVIPLGLETEKDGWISFHALDFENFPSNLHVYFSDSRTGIRQNLMLNKTVRMNLKAGHYDDRLSLIFSLKDLQYKPGQDENFYAYSFNGILYIYIRLDTGEKGKMSVYNTVGQSVYNSELFVNGFQQIQPDLKPGIYVLSLSSSRGNYLRKVFITNY